MDHKNINILVAEDDESLSFLLEKNLSEEGYSVILAKDGVDAWEKFNEHTVHFCVLDVMMPKQDGFSLAEMIRGVNSKVPILFLTAKTLKDDIYRGFETGGDDYITKPFTAKELLLRISAILRRTDISTPMGDVHMEYEIGIYNFDHSLRQLRLGTQGQRLSTKESELLRIFCEGRNTVINRNRLLLEVWGKDDYFVSKSLDVYISKLRKYLKEDPSVSIQNYHSFGYKMIVK